MRERMRGFTLLELLVAMAMFLAIAGGALALFSSDLPVYTRQQNQAGLNIAVRNAVSQMQLDVVNAGSGYYVGTNVPDWPIGVTIQNNVSTSACNTPSTFTYGANCFDQLNVITTDQATPPSHPDNGTFTLIPTSDCMTTTTSPMYLYPSGVTTAAMLAADYHTGDQILLVGSSNSVMNTLTLTANGTTVVAGGKTGVKLTFNTTAGNGTNTAANDPLGISTNASAKLANQFCSGDWVLRLAAITYKVDLTTPTDPKLVRVQGGTASTLAEQVIGFKVGAALWNVADDTPKYYYDASAYPPASGTMNDPYNYSRVRAVRISLIGRTTPQTDPTYTYRNGFDNGPYQVEGISVVVNPRNMTMNPN
jgi:prepilin-type N-terminal cleavage/methylation domain-containing protein